MGARTDLRGRIDIPSHVRDVTEGYEPRTVRKLSIEILEQHATVVIYIDIPNGGTGLVGEQAPRQQIGSVLCQGEQYFIGGTQRRAPPCRSNEVNTLGASPHPYHLLRLRG